MEKKEIFRVEGMSCSGCAGTVHSALMQADGVSDARVDHERGIAEITHSLPTQDVASIVAGAGYRVVEKVEP
ncbi:heavy metal-associated domain-containing protein [Balneolales bacterium ANBcel1]|nr:heavy metal-associated domain-containing protein [Balneolales bacterium ANBcel1]